MSIKEWIYFNKRKIFIFICILFFSLFYIYYYFYNDSEDGNDINNTNDIVLDDVEVNEEVIEIKDELCFFDIKGEVKKPGVYSIECSKRVNDAIVLSGGLTNNSDTSVINLSKKIEDGMVIIIYTKTEVKNYLDTIKKEESKQEMCNSSNVKNDACINTNNSNDSRININTASLEELMTLSGIGESKAKNIISYRSLSPFKKIEDLLNVEGIGESIYVKIKENITV